MTLLAEPEPIVLALAVDDASLADRLAALLADLPGLRLVGPGEPADARLVGPGGDLSGEVRPGESRPGDADPPLTAREVEVLSLLAEGASNKAVARRLGISVHTAKFHVGQLIDKLDAIGRTDAVAQAARLGVLRL